MPRDSVSARVFQREGIHVSLPDPWCAQCSHSLAGKEPGRFVIDLNEDRRSSRTVPGYLVVRVDGDVAITVGVVSGLLTRSTLDTLRRITGMIMNTVVHVADVGHAGSQRFLQTKRQKSLGRNPHVLASSQN